MCTAIALDRGSCLFGRTLDLEYHYDEEVTLSPRRFSFASPSGNCVEGEFAILGMAMVTDGYPLYYDAMNERGLCMAGLHFPGNGVYLPPADGAENLPPYALIPRILSSCATLTEARVLLSRLRLVDRPFSETLPLTPLHWIISKDGESLVAEPTLQGLRVYENPLGVLTNNPDFPAQLSRVPYYIGLSPKEPKEQLLDATLLPPASRGKGAFGMPGDFSSPSRFIRGLFVRQNALPLHDKAGAVEFFRLMETVSLPRGVVEAPDGRAVYTIYTSCCDPIEGIYYYTTYENPTPCGVRFEEKELNGSVLVRHPLRYPVGDGCNG